MIAFATSHCARHAKSYETCSTTVAFGGQQSMAGAGGFAWFGLQVKQQGKSWINSVIKVNLSNQSVDIVIHTINILGTFVTSRIICYIFVILVIRFILFLFHSIKLFLILYFVIFDILNIKYSIKLLTQVYTCCSLYIQF